MIYKLLSLCLLPCALFSASISDVPQEEWDQLNQKVKGRLKKESHLLMDLQNENAALTISNIIFQLKNPFTLQKQAWGTHSTGLYKGWKSEISPYVIKAETVQDIVEGVKFAKKHAIRLVVKGAGHDYLGRSNAPDSLLIWTHSMRNIEVHKAFTPQGSQDSYEAVTVEAGTRWGEVYQEVVTKHKKYVQGGGCTSVGACGGFLFSGGFNGYSKKFGSAAASLLEAEIVLADGEVLTVNAHNHPDLFWALKGGGGGTFGIVTKATLALHPLPDTMGKYLISINVKDDATLKELISQFLTFYRKSLHNPHWGEQAKFYPDRSVELALALQDLSLEEVESIWAPFIGWLDTKKGLSLMIPILKSFQLIICGIFNSMKKRSLLTSHQI